MKKSNQLFLSFIVFLSLGSCSEKNSPDIIFLGGPILTVDQNNLTVEATAIKDGLISQTGKQSKILKSADANTRIIDLKGKTLIPGFVAAHEHPTLSAVFSKTVDVSGFSFDSAKPMWKNLKQRVAEKPSGEWVFAMGLDPVLMPDLVLPDINFLDQIAPDNPLVIISQTMHSFWANSKAFEALQITKDTPDPGQGSYYGKDDSGELNGFISESTAAKPFIEKLQSPLSVLKRYENTLQNLVESGFTSVASAGFNMPPLMARYASSDGFKPRIRQFFYLRMEELEYLPDPPETDNDTFRVVGVKLWYDGSPYTGTMALEAPYLNNPLTAMMGIKKNQSGEPRIKAKAFAEQISKFTQQGWQLAIHSQGDRASEQAATAIQENLDKNTFALRNRFEHCLLIKEETLNQFKRLGLTPSFHINHIYYYGDALAQNIIGEQRAQRVLPLKTAFELGLHPSIHTDSPMFPTDPFSLMKTAITRKTKSGRTLGPEQAINVQQALRSMTINPAWQLHMDKNIGSIEVGKYADLTVLNNNPYTLNVDDWDQLKVEQVWLAGQEKFTRPSNIAHTRELDTR